MSWLLDMGEGDDDQLRNFASKKKKSKKPGGGFQQSGSNQQNRKRNKGKKNVKNVKDLFEGIKRGEERGRKKRIERMKNVVELKSVKDITPSPDKSYCIFPLRICETYPEGGGVVGDESGTISVKLKKRLKLGRYVQLTFRCNKRSYQNRDYTYYSNFRVLEEWENLELKKRVLKGCYMILMDLETEEILMERSRVSQGFSNFRYLLRSFMNKHHNFYEGLVEEEKEEKTEKTKQKRKKINVNVFRGNLKGLEDWSDDELEAVSNNDMETIFPFVRNQEKIKVWKLIFEDFLEFFKESCQNMLKKRKDEKITKIHEAYDCFCGQIQYNFGRKRMETHKETSLRVFEEKMNKNLFEYIDRPVELKDCKVLRNLSVGEFCFVKMCYTLVEKEKLMTKKIIAFEVDPKEEVEGEGEKEKQEEEKKEEEKKEVIEEKKENIEEEEKKSFVINELLWIKIDELDGLNVPQVIKDGAKEMLKREKKK